MLVLKGKIEGRKSPPNSHLVTMKSLIVFLAISFFTKQSYGQCDFKSPAEVLSLIRSNHPQLSLNTSTKKMLEKNISVAKQRPNPEMDLEANSGDTSEGNKITASIALRHVVELGNKREVRVNLAQKEYQAKVAGIEVGNEDIVIETVLNLYRLRQISESIPLYEEALQAFNKILKTKRKRNALSPEEEVEKETLELATNDYRLKLSQLMSEKINLNRHISLFANIDCEIPLEALPSKVNFSENFSLQEAVIKYSKLLAAKKEIEFAQASSEYEKSIAYPDLRIGPTYEYEANKVNKNHTIGIALTMDLPILNRNSAGKSVAAKRILVAQKNYKNIEEESKYDLEAWISKYNRYKLSLKTITNRTDLEKKHQKIEKLFSRGIISTSLVIESHRQLLEFTSTRYEFELGAVEALWNIYKLKGEINNKNI